MEATPPQPPANPPTGEQTKPVTGEQAAASSPHSTDPHERIDGLRAWVAQVDRKLGIRTYAFAAACVLSLAAAAVAIVFALQLQEDSATNDDLDSLRGQLGSVEQSASQAAREDVQSLTDRLDALESKVSSLESDQSTSDDELQVVQDDIDDLRTQIDDLESSSNTGSDGASSP